MVGGFLVFFPFCFEFESFDFGEDIKRVALIIHVRGLQVPEKVSNFLELANEGA